MRHESTRAILCALLGLTAAVIMLLTGCNKAQQKPPQAMFINLTADTLIIEAGNGFTVYPGDTVTTGTQYMADVYKVIRPIGGKPVYLYSSELLTVNYLYTR